MSPRRRAYPHVPHLPSRKPGLPVMVPPPSREHPPASSSNPPSSGHSAACVSSRRFQGRAGTEPRLPLRGRCPLSGEPARSPALSGPGPFILMDPAPLARGAPPAPAHPALKILSANTAQEPMEMPMAGARGQLLASALWTRLSLWDLGAPSSCPHTPRKQRLRQSQAYQHPPRRVALAGSCPPQPGPQRPLPQNPRAQQTQ